MSHAADVADRQAKVLAEIAALPPETTIAEWNKRRFTADIIAQEIRELRASFVIPDKKQKPN